MAASVGQTDPLTICFVASTIVGLIAGCANWFVVTMVRVNPLIATLGSSVVIVGVTLALTVHVPFAVIFSQFRVLGAGRIGDSPTRGSS